MDYADLLRDRSPKNKATTARIMSAPPPSSANGVELLVGCTTVSDTGSGVGDCIGFGSGVGVAGIVPNMVHLVQGLLTLFVNTAAVIKSQPSAVMDSASSCQSC